MNTVRRGLLQMPLTTADILGASVPAWAASGHPIKGDTTIVTTTAAGTQSTSQAVDALTGIVTC
jgi:hypothetical protein